MPSFFTVLQRYYKFIAAFTVVATGVAFAISALLPAQYVSVATALPANLFAADKSTVFNSNIQELYSALGTADDLDQIIGTARLDTIFIATVHDLKLATHYGFGKDEESLYKAIRKLKHAASIAKSEWGELKIKAWDNDRNMAAQIANTLLQKLQALHQALRNQTNELVLQALTKANGPTLIDTVQHAATSTLKEPAGSAQEYKRLLAEYNLMVATNPPALLVVEHARPALYPDNSEKLAAIVLTFFMALLFSTVFAFYREGKKMPA